MVEKVDGLRVVGIYRKGKDEDGNKVVNQYTVKKKIGEGGWADVFLGECGIERFAIKVVRKSVLRRKKEFVNGPDGTVKIKTALDNVYKEIEIHKNLNHAYILKLFEIIDTPESEKLYLVTEFCQNGQLLDWDSDSSRFICSWHPKNFELSLVQKLLHQLAISIHFLHTQKVVHCDIKPQNILITSNFDIKLADFGQALNYQDSDIISRPHGTSQFMSPESPDSTFSGKSSDIWALGITIYACIYRQLPYTALNIHDLLNLIENSNITFPKTPKIPASLINIMKKMLDPNPNTRISLEELLIQDQF